MADTKQTAGGVLTPSPVLVSCDQVTIVGDGSHEHPLHAGPGFGGSSIRCAFTGNGKAVGIPVAGTEQVTAGTSATVRATSVAAIEPGGTDFLLAATALGIVTQLNTDGTVQVAPAGLVTLTAGQWSAVVEGGGSLVVGRTYYAALGKSGQTTAAYLSLAAPPSPGDFTTVVGVAVSPTTMLVAPSAPQQNLGQEILFGTFTGSPPPLGGLMLVAANNSFEAVLNGSTILSNQGVGVLAALTHAGNPIVQFSGLVTLTQAQWLAVTDSTPGMIAGQSYYGGGGTFHGQLTKNSPSTGFRIQVGVGVSGTQLAISPYLQVLGGT